MSFMQEIINRNIPIWDACAETPFVRELKSGKLPFEKFKQYMIQDSIYLKHYARIYGKAIYHSTALRDIQVYYSVLSFVTDTESAVRLNYLHQFGMTDDDIEIIEPLAENQEYIDYMFEIAERGNICEILMTVLPCMVSYSYIFRKVAADPESKNSRYLDFIQDYADDKYYEDCKAWCEFVDTKCSKLSAEDQKRLSAIFEKASVLELNFWKMAYSE